MVDIYRYVKWLILTLNNAFIWSSIHTVHCIIVCRKEQSSEWRLRSVSKLQCSAEKYTVVQCTALQCSAEQCSAVEYNAVECITVQ